MSSMVIIYSIIIVIHRCVDFRWHVPIFGYRQDLFSDIQHRLSILMVKFRFSQTDEMVASSLNAISDLL